MVAAELAKWRCHWQATDELADPLPPWPAIEHLAPALGEEVRKVGRSFKWLTGPGLDQIHPRHQALVLDGCLRALASFYHLAEVSGRWADPMACPSFFLLAKPTGGFRTIGLLSSLCRVWAKLRLSLARAWSARVPR